MSLVSEYFAFQDISPSFRFWWAEPSRYTQLFFFLGGVFFWGGGVGGDGPPTVHGSMSSMN